MAVARGTKGPPTLTLPLKGGGKRGVAVLSSPSPLRGEGRGGGDLSTRRTGARYP